MKICKIWDADYPWDIRVKKILLTLEQAGHTVDLVCRNQARRKRLESNGCLTIRRLPAIPSALGPLHTICNFPFPFNPVWIKAIATTIRHAHSDLVLVRDLPLALPAAILGRVYRVPVVLDMAENYPAMLADRLNYTQTSAIGRCVRHPLPARLIELLIIRLVHHIIVVVDESRDRLLRDGVSPDRVSVVCNTPRIDQWKLKDYPQIVSHECSGLNLVYLGNLDGSRGIDVAIQAVRHLKDIGYKAKLSVIGDGPNILKLRELVIQCKVSDRVTIMGRLPFSQVQSIMAESHIGLIPHYSTAAWNSTIPNKLFDYMLLGLPVIVSDAKPTARIVQAEGCGEVFQDRNPFDLARCIRALEPPQLRQQMGTAGMAAVQKRYNWNYDAPVLLRSVASVANNFA
jgi:glycosyltransferase involved in cell wall biosynthesis